MTHTADPGTATTTPRVGFGRVDITPDWSLPLAGFAFRDAPSDGVAHPIFLRAALFEAGSRALLVTADLLGWAPDLVDELRPRLAERFDIPAGHILFAATHTHSAPQASTWIAHSVGAPDERFRALLRARTLEVVRAAVADREPVRLSRGDGRHELGMYRRMPVDGRILLAPNPDGPTDPRLVTIAVHRTDGSLKGAMVHYTCHPVVSGEQRISGDFAGAAMNLLADDTGATFLYLQGCCGDINPADLAGAGLSEVDRQARRLAGAVRDLLAGPRRPLEPVPPAAVWRTADLPLDHRPSQADLDRDRDAPGVLGEWARALGDHPERRTGTMPLRAQRLDLADGLSLLAMNGEVTVRYGLTIRELSDDVLPVAYANGMIGYLPTAAQIAEGGYEPDESARYYLLPGRYSPQIEPRITAVVTDLVRTRPT